MYIMRQIKKSSGTFLIFVQQYAEVLLCRWNLEQLLWFSQYKLCPCNVTWPNILLYPGSMHNISMWPQGWYSSYHTHLARSTLTKYAPIHLVLGPTLTPLTLGNVYHSTRGLPAHKTRFWIFRFKMCCLQIFSLKQQVSMATNDKNNDLFSSSNLEKLGLQIFPKIMLIFSLQENMRGAPASFQLFGSL